MVKKIKKRYKKIGIQLERSEEKFRKLFELSPVGMALVEHATGKFIEVNDALLNFLGYSKKEFMSMSFWDITPMEYKEQEARQIEELNQFGDFGPSEKEYIKKDKTRLHIRISGFMLKDIDGTEVVWGIIENIEVEKEHEKIMEQLALYDQLTGLANRSLLTDRFNQAQGFCKRNNKKLGLMFIDLDKFKLINDNYGHYAGDCLLKEVASRIKMVTRREIDTVARIGGDEFVVLIPELESRESLELLASKICLAISEPISFENEKLSVSVSIGISIYPDHGNDEHELLRFADKGMYQAKESGGNDYKLVD